jgi:hypothetical protein
MTNFLELHHGALLQLQACRSWQQMNKNYDDPAAGADEHCCTWEKYSSMA